MAQPKSCICKIVLALLLLAAHSFAYSVLTHEELIDLAWNDSIRPLLLARFPNATEDQLRVAHAYAYGGSAIQDMGYYPFGKRLFSNLTHYVRSGDFILWMFRNARTIDEYAFAIGALSHYLGDSVGHAEAINLATAVEFPKLEQKFGHSVTYDQNPHAHIRTEFAFDVDEMSEAPFAPPGYMNYIGLQVPRKFLERAFLATYGFDIHEIVGRARPSLRSYRTSVRSFIPAFAEAEVVLHHRQFPPHPDDEAYRIFADRVKRTNYERRWKHAFKKPGFKAHLLAIFIFIVPKIGGAADLSIKIPNAQTQEWYLRSVNHTVDVFHETLSQLMANPEPTVRLVNIDLDTGNPVKLGDYPLADETYAQLLGQLTRVPERTIPEDLKQNIFLYYSHTARNPIAKERVAGQLAALKVMKTSDPK